MKRYQVGLDRILAWVKGQTSCEHKETQICYRDDYATGHLVCWKEFCMNCHKMLRSGIGPYDKKTDIPGRITKDHPNTVYDEGYYLNLDALKAIDKKEKKI